MVELTVWVRTTVSAAAPAWAETVTTWAVSQFWSVKVRVVLSRDRSVPDTPATVTVTSPAGSVSKTTE